MTKDTVYVSSICSNEYPCSHYIREGNMGLWKEANGGYIKTLIDCKKYNVIWSGPEELNYLISRVPIYKHFESYDYDYINDPVIKNKLCCWN